FSPDTTVAGLKSGNRGLKSALRRPEEAGSEQVNLNLKDKVVVVTGGAAGIGRATVEAFEREGAQVISWDVTSDPKVDVTDAKSVEAATDAVIAKHGRIDVLVNNAGIVRDSQLIKWKDGAVVSMMDDATFDAVINVNLKGVFACTRAVVPHMIKSGGGVVLNASSIVGLYGNFGQTNYAATKAGVISFTQTWARELGRYNIRVNCVAPGFIATEMVKAMPQKVLDTMAAKAPLARLGEPSNIADAYVWLASDAAAFVHGAVLSVDGGLVLGT
ncbi:MAG: SDR family oxidoreductase, partial [Thermoanaerobaculia bacterium]